MGRAVVSDRAGSVDHENNGKILNADILHDLIVRTLQKGRINADYGFQTADSLPRGKRYGVFFRNADVAGVEQIVVEVEQYSYDVEKSVRMSLDYLMEAPFVKASYSK